jgi:ribosomal protein S18 acetylase RimI-like enzyme
MLRIRKVKASGPSRAEETGDDRAVLNRLDMRENGIVIKKVEGPSMAKWRRLRAIKRFVCQNNAALWYEKDLLEGCAAPDMTLPVRIDIHDAEGTLRWLRSFQESWMYNEKEIDVGLREGHYFANAKLNGRIIGYTKIGIGRVYLYDFGTCLALPSHVSFLYHVYVDKEFRKNSIAQDLIIAVIADLVPKGYRKMACHIAKWNTPSIRLFESLGFRRIADVRFHGFFKLLKIWTYRMSLDGKIKIALRMPNILC